MGFLKGIGTTELVIILSIAFLLFGGTIVRNVAKKAGETTKELKRAKKEFEKASNEE